MRKGPDSQAKTRGGGSMTGGANELRRRAEELLAGNHAQLENIDQAGVIALAHELAVHQIELELQNEELKHQNEQLEQARRELEEAQVHYIDLYDFAPVGYLTLDRQNHITEVNLTACEILKQPRLKLHGAVFTKFLSSGETNEFYFCCKRIRETRLAHSADFKMVAADGATFYARLELVLDKKGGLRVSMTDVTERKRLEERLATQERLAYLGKMSGTIAHEVRNPLATIDSSATYLELALKDADEKTKQHLQRMKRGVQHASTVIQKLLEMSRMKEPVFAPLDLESFVSGIVATSNVPGTVSVVFGQSVGQLEVQADEEQLRMAFGNIIRNAIEAMPEGGTLTISMRNNSRWAEVSIKDTGQGIPPEALPRLFDPLFTTKQGGVGFGLALARTVMEKHGGKIEAKSEPGKGATFILTLPLRSQNTG